MKFLCPSCKAKYQIADEKVAGRSVRMKCRKCGFMIQVSSAMAAPSGIDSDPPEMSEADSRRSAVAAGCRSRRDSPPAAVAHAASGARRADRHRQAARGRSGAACRRRVRRPASLRVRCRSPRLRRRAPARRKQRAVARRAARRASAPHRAPKRRQRPPPAAP